MESEDPYRDFRRSMEEMVAAHGLNDWERLEELLVWYLKSKTSDPMDDLDTTYSAAYDDNYVALTAHAGFSNGI
ncbi:hypothetical protein OPV22_005932 [Ensete ventricosum]|uniref:Transcription repressor n=1 Tax=Ensete ventricosum TaxID=4639 RepID=A0AAV8Q497_ENSVE|nr:hypothetical protein OPV22_005932 [Ensete ventricosum]